MNNLLETLKSDFSEYGRLAHLKGQFEEKIRNCPDDQEKDKLDLAVKLNGYTEKIAALEAKWGIDPKK